MANILFALAIFFLKKGASSRLSNFFLILILDVCTANGDFFVLFLAVFIVSNLRNFSDKKSLIIPFFPETLPFYAIKSKNLEIFFYFF